MRLNKNVKCFESELALRKKLILCSIRMNGDGSNGKLVLFICYHRWHLIGCLITSVNWSSFGQLGMKHCYSVPYRQIGLIVIELAAQFNNFKHFLPFISSKIAPSEQDWNVQWYSFQYVIDDVFLKYFFNCVCLRLVDKLIPFWVGHFAFISRLVDWLVRWLHDTSGIFSRDCQIMLYGIKISFSLEIIAFVN